MNRPQLFKEAAQTEETPTNVELAGWLAIHHLISEMELVVVSGNTYISTANGRVDQESIYST